MDENTPGKLSRIVEETVGGVVQRVYGYGYRRLSQRRLEGGNWVSSYYLYDGGGDVRALASTAGVVTDSYDYDAFGNSLASSGATPNAYLYKGERFDSDLGLYHLRARFYQPNTGRFLTEDPLEGDAERPVSQHRYQYAAADPVNLADPTGKDFAYLLITGFLSASRAITVHVLPSSPIDGFLFSPTGRDVYCVLKKVYSVLELAIDEIDPRPNRPRIPGECVITASFSSGGGGTGGGPGGTGGGGGGGGGGDQPPKPTVALIVRRMWSEQFATPIANYLPCNTATFGPAGDPCQIGGAGKRSSRQGYILMGSRANGEAWVGARIAVNPSTPEARSRLLFRLRDHSGRLVGTSSISSVLPNGDVDARIVVPMPSIQVGASISALLGVSNRLRYSLVAGCDQNGDSILDDNEVLAYGAYSYIIVSQFVYTDMYDALNAGGALAGIGLTIADDFIRSFINGQPAFPGDIANLSANQGSTDPRFTSVSGATLDHAVGVPFATEVAGNIPSYRYSGASDLARRVRRSAALRDVVERTWAWNRGAVPAFFAQAPTVNSNVFGPWPLRSSSLVLGNFRYSSVNDFDLFVTFGTAAIEGAAQINNCARGCVYVTVAREPGTSANFRVTEVSVVGTLYDLYDFDNEAGLPAPFAAKMQAGFGTLSIRPGGTQGGNVREHRVPFTGVLDPRPNLRF